MDPTTAGPDRHTPGFDRYARAGSCIFTRATLLFNRGHTLASDRVMRMIMECTSCMAAAHLRLDVTREHEVYAGDVVYIGAMRYTKAFTAGEEPFILSCVV